MDIDVSNGAELVLMAGAEAVAPPGLGSLRGASQGLRPGLMNFAPSGLVWWCSRQRRRPWSRDLHGSRSAWVAVCTGHDLHGSRSAWGSRSCMERVLHRVPLQGGVPERRRVVVSGADERCVGLIMLAWRGFVVLAEQAAAHIAAAAQARAPVPTRVVATS